MSLARREFIKQFGIALASLLMARCVVPGKGGRTPRELAGDRLRDCWMRFGWLAEETRRAKFVEQGSEVRDQLVADHQAALDALVATGELEPAVAEQVQKAFDAAAYHVWRSYSPITCYEPALVNYKPASSDQLVHQAEVLAAMSRSSDLNPDAMAQAQAAIERDIAFLNLSDVQVQALYQEVIASSEAGSGVPAFDQIELPIVPEAADAARFLVELLLGD